MQVLSVSEGQKRSTTGGNDAMNEGAMALYAVQSDVRMSGYGITDLKLLGCPLRLRTSPATVTLSALAPVVINSPDIAGQDLKTDTLLVFYGMTNGTLQGDSVNSITASPIGNGVQTAHSFSPGDWVIVAPGTRATPCATALNLDKVNIVNTTPPTFYVTWTVGPPYAVSSIAFNQGQNYRAVGYAVRNGNLTTCDFSVTDCSGATNPNWTSIADNIVSLRAQYGRDTTVLAAPVTMDGFVDVNDKTAPTTGDTACGWARISAIRFALVARSAQSEKTTVTTVVPKWDGSDGTAANEIDLLTGNSQWQYYRYKVFQTTVPMRNVSWMGAVAGC
jgi:type IV pilus assembly protein PilW